MSVVECAQSLERQGWAIDFALSLGHALSRLSRASYDFVILDLTLPDAPGTDAWVEIHQSHPRLKGIITTHSASLRAHINPLGPGLVSYLLKPIDARSVIALVDRALGPAGALSSSVSQARLSAELYDEWLGRFRQPFVLDLEANFKIIQARLDSYFTQLQVYLQSIPQLNSLQFPALSAPRVLVASLVVLVLCLGGLGTTAVAAQGALPGDGLYPLKTMVEAVELTISPDAASRAQLHLIFASHRADEIQALISQGRTGPVPTVAAAFEQEINQATAELDRAAVESPARTAALASQLAQELGHDVQILSALREVAPSAVKADLERALRSAETGIALAELRSIPQTPVALLAAALTGTPTIPPAKTGTSTLTFEPTSTGTLEAIVALELTETPQPSGTVLTAETPVETGTPVETFTPAITDTPPPTTQAQSTTSSPTETSQLETDTPEPTDTNRMTNTPRPSETPQSTETFQPSDTPQPTDTRQPTNTPQPTDTPQPTNTRQPTDTPQPTDTRQPTNTPQPTNTAHPSNTPAPTNTKSPPPPGPRPTHTPKPTHKPKPTKVPHAPAVVQAEPMPGGAAHANLANARAPGQDHSRPGTDLTLSDEFLTAVDFIIVKVRDGLLFFIGLL